MITLTIKEETFGSGSLTNLEIPIFSYHLTLSELIEAKVKAKVHSINAGLDTKDVPTHFLSSIEKKLNRPVLDKKKEKHREGLKALQLDAEKATYEALDGFQKNAFFVLVDGEQKTELQEELHLTRDSEVHFIRLTPLVGG